VTQGPFNWLSEEGAIEIISQITTGSVARLMKIEQWEYAR